MMLRFASAGAAVALVFAISAPLADAQSTERTDQSEEDWRRSQKASSGDPFDPLANPSDTGWGATLPPVRPIDQLPEESRRHLMRQRARVIAEMEFGEAQEAAYEPSEAAKTDPALAAEEEAVWDVILTDLQAGGGGDSDGSGDGPHKIAVAGQGEAPVSGALGGGSTRSAAEILAELKGLSTGGGASGGPAGTPAKEASGAPAGDAGEAGQDNTAEASASGGAGAGDSASAGGAAAEAVAEDKDSPLAEPPRSLLDLPGRADDREATGTRSSASDFLKSGGPDPSQ